MMLTSIFLPLKGRKTSPRASCWVGRRGAVPAGLRLLPRRPASVCCSYALPRVPLVSKGIVV